MSITKNPFPELKTLVESENFKIEEVGNIETGEIHNELFINGLMSVDEIIYAVKKYDIEKVWYQVGTDKTHTFPLIMKTRRSQTEEEEKFDINNAQDLYPIHHKEIFDGKEWKTVYNHSI